MANINNYQTDLVNVASRYRKYTVSRLVSSTKNPLVDTEIPANIPEKFILDIALYSLADNSLVFQAVYPSDNNEIFEIRNLIYSDGTVRRLLFVNFNKAGIVEVDGRYEMVVSFLVEDFGNHTSDALYVTRISPSRTEIEMKLLPEHTNQISASMLTKYITPQITSDWMLGVMQQIFNQPNSSTLGLPTDNTTLTYDIIEEYFSNITATRVSASKVINESYENMVTESIQMLQNKAYTFASESISLSPEKSFTDKMIFDIVSSSLVRAGNEITTEVILL